MSALLRAELAAGYGEHRVLSDIRLTVSAGELIAVTGPSGSGKTTLLRTLAGALAPQLGTVLMSGAVLTGRDSAVAAGVALIPQGNGLLRVLTALENVLVPLATDARRFPEAAVERARQALAAVDLAEAAEQLLEELSGGQQQRVAVARGLATRAVIVLADEPTSELDAVNRARVMELLRGEADRGAAVLVATHDPESAAVCDAELRLQDGYACWLRDDRG